MLNAATNLIKMKKLQLNSVKVKEKWCAEQEEDLKKIFQMIDELIAQACCASTSHHSYSQLEDAKRNFTEEFLEIAEKYRIVAE